jgi:cobalt/nickel transport system permease protein
MHIPDGYLGPQTYVPLYAATVALEATALAKLQRTLRLRQVPILALGAAFSFVIMMFNIPIPGGTTGHAVGAVLIAILLGPWAAMIAVSLALIIQAFLFGDGGITALGANCFNMAIVMPFVGFGIYRLIAGNAPAQSRQHWLGAALGGYVGLCAAAILTGFEFGIQPLLAHDAAGRALYCPFSLKIAVPVMALEHLLVFGWLEALVTGLVIAYLQRTAPEMLTYAPDTSRRKADTLIPAMAMTLGILVLLSPLGLYLPDKFNAGSAWGEWNTKEILAEMAKVSGNSDIYIPKGLQQAEQSGWKAPLPDYALPGQNSASLPALSLSYILSGALGVTLLGLLIMLSKRWFSRKDEINEPSAVDAGTHQN